MCNPIERIFNTVTIKFTAPNKLERLVKCIANITKSTEGPEWALIDDRGGYHFCL